MDLKKTPTCRRRVGMTMVFALATIAVTLTGSGVAPLAGAPPRPRRSPLRPRRSPLRPARRAATKQAPLPPEPIYMTIFTPRLTLPAAVKTPSGNEAGAFAALNALIDRETLFGDAIIGMRVSLDRAQAAASGGAQLWSVRQANASAEYALGASRLVGSFPALAGQCGPSLRRRQDERDPYAGTVRDGESEAPARPAVVIYSLAPAGCDGVPAFHGPRGRFAEGRASSIRAPSSRY